MSEQAVSTKCTPLTEAEVLWLNNLRRSISGRGRVGKSRQMKGKEWRKLTSIIAEHSLPCTMWPNSLGFDFFVHNHHNIQGVRPDIVFSCEGWQTPGPGLGFENQIVHAEKIAEITHTDDNRRILEWYGLPDLMDPESYTY